MLGQTQTHPISHLAPSCSKLLKHSYNELWIKKKEKVQGLPGSTADRSPPANARDMGLIPGPTGQVSMCTTTTEPGCLGNSTDGGAWRAAVHGAAKSRTGLSD